MASIEVFSPGVMVLSAWVVGWWGCADRAGVGCVGAGCTRSRASELFSTKKTCSQERLRAGVCQAPGFVEAGLSGGGGCWL